jgi:hypothetical protein
MSVLDSSDSLLSGDGSPADFINEYGDNYVYNQSPYDAIDNGLATKDAGTASVSSPGWMNSLFNVFSGAADIASKAGQMAQTFTGKTTRPNSAVANPGPGAPSSGLLRSVSTNYIVVAIAVAAAIGIGLWLVLRRH